MMTDKDRQRMIEMIYQGVCQVTIADELNIAPETIYRYLSGRSDHMLTPTQTNMLKVAKARKR